MLQNVKFYKTAIIIIIIIIIIVNRLSRQIPVLFETKSL